MALNPPLELALIGTGNRSQTTYAPLFNYLQPWVRLVAVCDPVKENANRFADAMKVPAFYSLADLVKARPMEAALVVAPVDIHHAISCYLMQHGIHCHVETSMSSLLIQAREMVETAQRYGVTLRVAENFFRMPFDRIARKIDQSGFLGPINRVLCLHDHTGYHNNSRWIHFMGSHPETVQAIRHTMSTNVHHESPHRIHTSETFRAHFFTFPGNRLVIDEAANIKGLLGRYPRPGYTELDGERGAIVRTATDQSNPTRGWTSEAEVRYTSDSALKTNAIADKVYSIKHVSRNGVWLSDHVDFPSARVEYTNPHQLPTEVNSNHAHRDYYGVAIVSHLVDFAEAVRGIAPSEYTEKDAYMAMMMEVATRESMLRKGELLRLPLTSDLDSESQLRSDLRAKYGVDPLDIEGMVQRIIPRP